MASFEEKIKVACDTKEIPGVVLLAADKTGKFTYSRAFGPKSPTEPMALDATFILASCTKLMTSIAALQCVERGLIGLDDSVSSVLPELAEPDILTGFSDDDKPILEKAKNKITLRHLLTHTSGASYDMMDLRLMKYRQQQGLAPGTRGVSMVDRLNLPLVFEPGTNWQYGMSSDWAGVLVARLNNTTLEAFMQKNIWEPLGISNITFHSELKPEVKKNLVTMTCRGGIENPFFSLATDTGKPVIWTEEKLYDDPIPIGEEYGGHGGMGSAVEYFKILTSLLLSDGKLLKPETVDLMFTPQLSEPCRAGLTEFNEAPHWKDTFASHEAGTVLDWGLGGILIMSDKEGGRRRGTMRWSGLPNLLWTVDREVGLATFYASNVVPFGDHRSGFWQMAFEKEMYEKLGRL